MGAGTDVAIETAKLGAFDYFPKPIEDIPDFLGKIKRAVENKRLSTSPVGSSISQTVGDEIIGNADVVVRDNRITAIGARGSVAVPADARVIDVRGKTHDLRITGNVLREIPPSNDGDSLVADTMQDQRRSLN